LKFGLAAALVLCTVLLASCLDFFTNSLGEKWVRDPNTIVVSSTNVDALLKESRGDPAASKGILDKIAAALKDNPNPDPKLQAAAVAAANQAAGLGELVLGNIRTVLEAADGEGGGDTFNKLLGDVQDTAEENDLIGVSASITDSLAGALTVTEGGIPKFKEGALEGVSEGDLTLLAFTLVLAEAEKTPDGTFDNYIETWADGNKLNGVGLKPSEQLIAAIGNKLAGGKGEIGSKLGDLLGKK
jgi:hypothetical protein